MFTEAATEADLGWLDGHAHEIAITLATTRTPAPALPISSHAHRHQPHARA